MEQINWLLVGTGDIAGKRVASALVAARGSCLIAVCDRMVERAQTLGARFGVEKVYADFGEALDKSGANAVYIATPVDLHVPQAIAALEGREARSGGKTARPDRSGVRPGGCQGK